MEFINEELLDQVIDDTLTVEGIVESTSRERARLRYLEIVPVLDEHGHRVGAAPRGLVHRLGLWHPAVFVVITEAGDQLLLQVRGRDASSSNRLDIAVGGHVGIGEDDYAQVAVREMREELNFGIEVDRLSYVSAHNRTTPLRPHRPLERHRERRIIYELILSSDERESLAEAFGSRENVHEVEDLVWLTLQEAISAVLEDRCTDGLKSVLAAWLSHRGVALRELESQGQSRS